MGCFDGVKGGLAQRMEIAHEWCQCGGDWYAEVAEGAEDAEMNGGVKTYSSWAGVGVAEGVVGKGDEGGELVGGEDGGEEGAAEGWEVGEWGHGGF